jgi:hypothetical protein
VNGLRGQGVGKGARAVLACMAMAWQCIAVLGVTRTSTPN